jgi:hypothetical protein
MDAGMSRATTTMDANSDVPTLKNAFDSSVITVSLESSFNAGLGCWHMLCPDSFTMFIILGL